jgi:hypothetical protein
MLRLAPSVSRTLEPNLHAAVIIPADGGQDAFVADFAPEIFVEHVADPGKYADAALERNLRLSPEGLRGVDGGVFPALNGWAIIRPGVRGRSIPLSSARDDDFTAINSFDPHPVSVISSDLFL